MADTFRVAVGGLRGPGLSAADQATIAAAVLSSGQVAAVRESLTGWTQPAYTVTEGFYYDPGSGAHTSAAGWRSLKYEITGAESALRATGKIGAYPSLIVYLDEADAFVGIQYPSPESGTTLHTNAMLTVPVGAAFVCVNSLNDTAIRLEAGALVEDVGLALNEADARLDNAEPKVDSLIEAVRVWEAPAGAVATANQYIDRGTGSAVSLSGYKTLSYELTGAEYGLRATGKIAGDATALAVYFDQADQWLGYEFGGNNDAPITKIDQILTLPAGTAKVVLTGRSDFALALEQGVVEPASGAPPALIGYWYQKSGAWFGTSIPAGGGPAGSYVTRVALALGMDITNEALGSSMARNGVAAKRTAADPCGWTGLNWQNVSRSLSMTLAEYDELIDNWETKWRDLLVGDDKPATVDESTANVWKDHSWENRLARHLGVDRPDLFVLDHGPNDQGANQTGTSSGALTGGNGDMEFLPATIPTYPDLVTGVGGGADPTRDRGTFLGAMNFLIDKILADKPRARIVFSGHYESQYRPNIVAGQKKLATYWSFRLIPLDEKLGWSQQTIKSGPSAGKTLTQVWMPPSSGDPGNVHPHSDETGEANDLIGEILTAEIRDVR
jgi:hypothetical protein